MKDQVFSILQAVGRSFMLPVAILPIAGLLLGIGASFTNATTIQTYGLESILGNGTILHSLLTIMSDAGNIIFGNLPIIFAVGVAIGMAKQEKEVAALSAMIAFFVMHASTNAVLKLTGKVLANNTVSPDVLEGTIANVCGIMSLQEGVFGGIIVGIGVAYLHNRYHKIVAAQCPVLLRRVALHPYHFHRRLHVRRHCHVFRLACRPERHLRPRRPGHGYGLHRHLDFRHHQAGPHPPSACITSSTCPSGRPASAAR